MGLTFFIITLLLVMIGILASFQTFWHHCRGLLI